MPSKKKVRPDNMAAKGGFFPTAGPAFAVSMIYLRNKAGLSLPQLAEKVGVSRLTIFRIEHGESVPDLNLAESLARALGATLIAMLRP